MSKLRRKYYNFFSKFYDAFIKAHSGDKQEKLREFLCDTIGVNPDKKILDICCGTGSTTYFLKKSGAFAVGADFSIGMLKKAKEKCGDNIFLLSDVSALPFKTNAFDNVVCTFAFYELKGETVDYVLKEIKRVLKKDGAFYMMEHEIPEKPIIKFLFYIRMFSMGFKKAMTILKKEKEIFRKFFKNVEKIQSPSKNSKIYKCY